MMGSASDTTPKNTRPFSMTESITEAYEQLIIEMQTAYIAAVNAGPEEGIRRIHNLLNGSGLLPSAEDVATGPDVYAAKNSVKDMPVDPCRFIRTYGTLI